MRISDWSSDVCSSDLRDASVLPEQTLDLEAADLLRIYKQAVNDLPEKTRRVFMMSRDEELTYSQISEQLGISMATVQYHMVRAIAFVAAAVKDHRWAMKNGRAAEPRHQQTSDRKSGV